MGYPSHREAVVVLRDGSTVLVRPVRPGDHEAILSFLKGISEENLYLRFFSGGINLEQVARWSVELDYKDRYGLIALAGPGQEIAAHATYVRSGDDRAEVGFEVADRFFGKGLGTILLGHLAEAAVENGISSFEGHVLAQNHRMIDVFRQSGFPVNTTAEPGEILFEFPTSLTEEGLERFEGREQTAAVAALKSFFAPSSVAVIGAGRKRGTIGGEIFHNLIAAGFHGPVYPVNPKADVVQSVVAYPSVTEIPGPVELGVVVVPADGVIPAARECGEKGVRSLVVISSGFAEVGNRDGERELLAVCREAGMRLIGPNCMGIINTAPDVALNATFAPDYPPHGRVGFLSQSGALGLAVIDRAASLGLGISSFVSVGNKADISGNDLVQYWDADEDTDVILLYLESFGNPRRFARIARRVGKRKPIIAVKSGRSPAGARATSSHTGAILAASDVTVDALFRQAGVIRTDTLAEMFDVASLLANQPAPAGNRVAIVTNAGGLGILCADTCEAGGLVVPPLPDEVRSKLGGFLPGEASLSNPVDMIASASAEDYRRTIEVIAAWGGIDAVIVIFIPPLVTRAEDVAVALRTAVEGMPSHIPVLSVFMSSRGVPEQLRDDRVRIPSYAFPEDAARALVRAVQYGTWLRKPDGRVPGSADLRHDEAAGIVAEALARGPGWLTPDEAWRLLACYGLPLIEQRTARTPKEAGEIAAEMGAPVALKAVAPDVLHKSEAGAVRVGLGTPSAVKRAAEEMRRGMKGAGHPPEAFLVQRMAPPGVEALVGVVSDPVFGPVLACGAGGTAVELLKDVSVRITPITEDDAPEMIRELKTFPLFTGYRGAPPADVGALEEVLLRVSAMVEGHGAIAEMDLNPVIVHTSGASIVDARIRLEGRPPRRPLGARRDV
jgi:acetyl coenzyme A synthetase (ADP forming)-like protein